MRVVNFQFEQEEFTKLAQNLYVLGSRDKALEEAIGYLSIWGLNYSIVHIYIRDIKDGELLAVYTTPELENAGFVMGAVFDKTTKKYSFHS